MIRTHLGRSRVRENRMLGSVGTTLNGLATRPSPQASLGAVTALTRRDVWITVFPWSMACWC
jgi:hypothetical protein